MRKFFYSLRLVSVVMLSLAMNACGVLNFNNLLGTNTLGGGATTVVEDLNASEVELFESGPVDIPVSISRLDAPDVTLIDVTISDISSDDSSSLFLTRVRTLETDTNYTFTFTGFTGAVADWLTTPYIYLRNTQTGDSRVGSVSATGTFSVALEGKTEQDFTLQAITGTDPTTAQGSSALVIRGNAAGAVSIKTTNAGGTTPLTPNMVIVVSNGFTFFSNLTADGTFNFWRRNLNGAQPTLLLSGLIYPIRLVSVFADNSAVFLDESGALIMASNIGTASVSVQTLRGRSLEVDATEEDLFSADILDNFDLSGLSADVLANNDSVPYSLITLPGKGVFVVKQFSGGADEGTTLGTGLVDFVDTEGGIRTIVPIVNAENLVYDDAYIDYDSVAKVLIVALSGENSPSFNIYSLDVSEDFYPMTEAFNLKTLKLGDAGFVHGMGANDNIIIYSVATIPPLKELHMIRNGGIPETILEFDQTNNPYTDIVKIGPGFAVSCRVESKELYFIPLGEDPVPEPILFATPGICRMKDIFIEQHRVYFYSLPDPSEEIGPDNSAQLTFIDLDNVPILQEALGQ